MNGTPSFRELVEALVAAVPPLTRVRGHPLGSSERAFAASLRERFIAGGVEALERSSNPDHWHQVSVWFSSPRQKLRFLRGPLRRRIAAWRARGLVEGFFFMNKPPGLRLRFRGPAGAGALSGKLERWLEAERGRGGVEGYEAGVYDAETHHFGGVRGLELAHEQFFRDSLTLLDLLALPRMSALLPDLPTLSLAVQSHFVNAICDDPWERWDAWRNLRLAGRVPLNEAEAVETARSEAQSQRNLLTTLAFSPERFVRDLDPGPRRVMRAALRANVDLAARWREAASRGELVYGLRKITPFLMAFHWNRWMVPADTQVTLGLLMQVLLDPKDPLPPPP